MFAKIIINAIGKTSKEYSELEKHYIKLCKTNIERNIHEGKTSLTAKQQIDIETEVLFAKINKKNACIITLDSCGKQLCSAEFANIIANYSQIYKSINFVIGGSHGLSDQKNIHSNLLLSLSKMTMPHQMARTMLLEQIYRAECIINNHSYHK